MGSSGSYTLLAISIIGYLLGIAGIIAGILGPAWWISDSQLTVSSKQLKIETGLIKECTPDTGNHLESVCKERPDILKFVEGDEFHKGISFVSLFLILFDHWPLK